MKRTYPANIDGQIFYIDEDAYLMLQDYLQQLRITFHGAEGAEIAEDIESRIREHFDARIAGGANVIVIEDVRRVIETMGRPEEISGEDILEVESEDSSLHENTITPEQEESSDTGKTASNGKDERTRKKLYRNMRNKVFGGVLGGVAEFLGWNATILRLLFAVFACLTYFWPCVILYLVLWMVIPPADTPRRILEMKGEPVNIDTVGQTIIANNPSMPPAFEEENHESLLTTLLNICGKVVMGFLGVIGGLGSFGCMIAFLVMGACAISWSGWNIPFNFWPVQGATLIACIMIWLLFGFIAFGSLAWTSCCVLFNTAAASRTAKITIFVMGTILITIGTTLAIIVSSM